MVDVGTRTQETRRTADILPDVRRIRRYGLLCWGFVVHWKRCRPGGFRRSLDELHWVSLGTGTAFREWRAGDQAREGPCEGIQLTEKPRHITNG